MSGRVTSLRSFKRRFVRGIQDPKGECFEPESEDTFWVGIANAEMAAHHDMIDCAACGSKDVCRGGFGNPDKFGTLTNADGHLYGYALCKTCHGDRESAVDRVDAAFADAPESA